MADTNKKALEFHKRLRGKIEVKTKSKLTAANLKLAYTPGVAAPCLEIAKDKSKVFDYTWKGNTILIVTDGSAVLGLGNIGAEASLPVMEGKSLLFKEFGGVDCIPICLATQDPKKIIEIVEALAPAYGGVNLEDISAPRCFEIEEELKRRLDIPVFHDDQHGTAIVVLAGLINAAKVVRKPLMKLRIVINGAGSAGVAIAKLLRKYGVGEIIVCDTVGSIYAERKENMNPTKDELAKITNASGVKGDLTEALKQADVFIGVSVKDALKPEMVKAMNPKAIIFALANPNPEILPDAAKRAGAAVIATGRSDFPNQINNVLAFPGVFRAALDSRAKITEKMKLAAALAIAGCVKKPTTNCIIPKALDKSVAKKVAAAVKRAI